MLQQLRLIPKEQPEPPHFKMRTYIYIREDGKAVHCQTCSGIFGEEYEHDDPNWQPPSNWPYEVVDLRK